MNQAKIKRLRPAAIPLLTLLLAGCAPGSQGGRPVSQPTPRPVLKLGILGLGGEVSTPIDLVGPYALAAGLPTKAPVLHAARLTSSASEAVSDLATELGVPGPPVDTGDGLAYNLGATTGYQLTIGPQLNTFNFHPNTPVDETGATPSIAAADQVVEQFLKQHGVPAGGGLLPLPQLSTYNAADRRVFFQWTLDSLPVFNILGQPQEIYADVAANYAETLSLVGISGAVPVGAVGAFSRYPSEPAYVVAEQLSNGQINPNAYLLQPISAQPFPSPSPASDPTDAEITGAELGVVDSFGTAVPVWVLQLSGRPQAAQVVVCAEPSYACLPLHFVQPTPSPSPEVSGSPAAEPSPT